MDKQSEKHTDLSTENKIKKAEDNIKSLKEKLSNGENLKKAEKWELKEGIKFFEKEIVKLKKDLPKEKTKKPAKLKVEKKPKVKIKSEKAPKIKVEKTTKETKSEKPKHESNVITKLKGLKITHKNNANNDVEKDDKVLIREYKHEEKVNEKIRKQKIRKYSKDVLKNGKIISSETESEDVKLNLKNNIIEIKDVTKVYYSGAIKNEVLKKISYEIERGDFVCILGPSGSGKTTMLNLISGLDNATSGDIFIDGINLSLLSDSDLTTLRRNKIGFVFQQYNLLPNLTALENIEVGANLAKEKNKEFIQKVIESIGLTEHVNKYPYQLSGGQQQRVSIARAIAKNPEILFCDEPTGALDEETGIKVLDVLQTINNKFNTAIIIVTHNKNISKLSKKTLNFKDGNIESIEKNKKQESPYDIVWSA